MNTIGTFEFNGETMTIVQDGVFALDGTPALNVMCADGDLWAHLTMCVPGASWPPKGTPLAEGEYLVKTYSENAPMRTPLLATLFTDTGRRVASGYTELEVWVL